MPILLIAVLLACVAAPAPAQPVFDVHVHLHDGQQSLDRYRADARKAHRQVNGLGAMWFGGPNQAPAGDIAATRRANDALLALARREPGVLPIATVHPYDGSAAVRELERVAARGMRVLKLHPHTQHFDAADPRVLALVTRAGALGVVVLFDNAGIVTGDHDKLFNLALAAPKTRFIFAHLGGLGFRFWNILALARTAEGLFADNIYFDLSATVVIAAGSPLADEFVWTVRNVGIEHVLLGSDFPQLSLDRTLTALDRLPFTAGERQLIRYDNARRLFGLTQTTAE
jgi:uncharacterized protein